MLKIDQEWQLNLKKEKLVKNYIRIFFFKSKKIQSYKYQFLFLLLKKKTKINKYPNQFLNEFLANLYNMEFGNDCNYKFII